MELKVVCGCGQKYAFDVEPVNGRMPVKVSCPGCGADGTATADAILGQHFPNRPAALPVAMAVTAAPAAIAQSTPPVSVGPQAPVGGGLRINIHRAAPAPAAAPPPAAPGPIQPARITPAILPTAARQATQTVPAGNPGKPPSFSLGLLGGFIGVLVGSIIYYLVFKFSGYRISILAIGVGGLAGWFGDYLGRGEGSKELGAIIAIMVLAGVVGAQYLVAMGYWHDAEQEILKIQMSAYSNAVDEAKAAVKAVPTGSDAEIRAYLVKQELADGEKVKPDEISADVIKDFRENQLPEYQNLAAGKTTKEEYEKKYEIKTSMTKEEKQEEENTLKGIFLLLLLSKGNIFSLIAAAGLTYKLSTNARGE
jgi:hypothetical protein